MTLREIIEKCDMLSVYEERCITDEYVELVFYNKEIAEWNKIFGDIFGPATKPVGVEPTKDDVHSAEDYGGIWADQTLFKRAFGDVIVIAMFWPWQDDIHTTLKMALLNSKAEGNHP
jgi:hypothetical protein